MKKGIQRYRMKGILCFTWNNRQGGVNMKTAKDRMHIGELYLPEAFLI